MNGLNFNTIANEDCITYMRSIPDNSIDFIFADPPYNLSKSKLKSEKFKFSTDKGEWDKFTDEDFLKFNEEWIHECVRILKPNGSIFISGTYHNIYACGFILSRFGMTILNEIIWHKSNATPNLTCSRLVADHENIIWARKGDKHTFNYKDSLKFNHGKQLRCLWTSSKKASAEYKHPTQKPEWLLHRLLTIASKEGDIILDPFLGSGTTAVVAKRMKRKYLGCEKDKKHFKTAEARLYNTFVVKELNI